MGMATYAGTFWWSKAAEVSAELKNQLYRGSLKRQKVLKSKKHETAAARNKLTRELF